MTRVVLFISFIFVGLDLVGQKISTLSFYAMPQRTMFLNSDDRKYGLVENTPTYAYSYGLMMSHSFTKRVGIEFGFCGSRVEQAFKVHRYKGSAEVGINKKKSVLYVNIPLLLRLNLISREKNILFVSAGPQATVLMSEDGIIPIYYSEPGIPTDTIVSYDISESSGAYKKLVFSSTGSFGWNRKIYKDLFFQVICRADYTITDIENKSFSTIFKSQSYTDAYLWFNKNRPATHIFTIGIGIGLCLKIN